MMGNGWVLACCGAACDVLVQLAQVLHLLFVCCLQHTMMRFSRGRLEGRALEHGNVAWVRSRANATSINRARKIRMLTPSGRVELVEDGELLQRMQRIACTLLPTLHSDAGFKTTFADQTVRHTTRCGSGSTMNVDLRGKFRRREAWVEVKWTRGSLETALGKALSKVSDFEAIAAEHAAWAFDENLGGQRVTKPIFVGGLGVSPSGWLLQFGDEQWRGAFVDLCGFGPNPSVLVQSQADKYRRYNQSKAGKQRTRKYSQLPKRRQGRKAYCADYAKTAHGRELRAAARQRYRDKNMV